MSEKLISIFMVVVSLLVLYLSYKVINTNHKLNRLSKRYDLLLRGRGELKLEDLLKSHSKDLEIGVKKIKALEYNYTKMSKENKSNYTNLNKRLDNSNEETVKMLQDKIQEENSQLQADFNSFNHTINKRVEELGSNLNEDIRQLEKTSFDSYKTLDDQYTDLKNKMDHKIKVENERITDKIDREIKNIRENVSLSIQKVSLYKYDALENQSGNLSFSLVLLDGFNSGVIITSINGRDASYTYSKEIKNGEPLADLSPEETKALDKAVNNIL